MIPHRPTNKDTTRSLQDSQEVRHRAAISIAAVSDLTDNIQKQLDSNNTGEGGGDRGDPYHGVNAPSAAASVPVHSRRGIGFFSSVPTEEERKTDRDRATKQEEARRESLLANVDARMKLGERKRQDYEGAIQHGKDVIRGGSVRRSVLGGSGNRRGVIEALSSTLQPNDSGAALGNNSNSSFQPSPTTDFTSSSINTATHQTHSETYTLNELAGFRPPVPQNHWGAAAPPADRDFFAVVSSATPAKGTIPSTKTSGPLPLCVNPTDGKSLFQKTAGMKVPEAGAKKTTHDLVRSVHDLLNNVQKLLYHSTVTSQQLDDVSARHASAMALVFETLGPETARVIRTTSEMIAVPGAGDSSSCASEGRATAGGFAGRSTSSQHKRQHFNSEASSHTATTSPRMEKSIESVIIEDGNTSVASLSRGASTSKLLSSRSPILTARSPTNLASQIVNRLVKTASMSNLSLGVQQQLQDEVETIDNKYRDVLMDVARELSVANNNNNNDDNDVSVMTMMADGGDHDAPSHVASASATNWISTSREAANSQRASARDVLHDVTAIRTLLERLEGEIDVKANPIIKENKALRMQLLKAHMDIRIMRNQLHKYKVTSKFRQLGAERKKRQELLSYVNECRVGNNNAQSPLATSINTSSVNHPTSPTTAITAVPSNTTPASSSSVSSGQISLKRRVTIVTVTAADVLLLQESLPPSEARQAIDIFRIAIGAVIADLPCAVLRSDFFAPSLLSGGAASGGDPLGLDDGGPMYNLRHLDRPRQDDANNNNHNNTPSTSVVATTSSTHALSCGKSFHANGFSGNGASAMIAFPDPIDALAFTERLHLLLVACPWSYQLINWHSPRGHMFPYGALREQDVEKTDPIVPTTTTASTTNTTNVHVSMDNGAAAAVNIMHFSNNNNNAGCLPFQNSMFDTTNDKASSPRRKSSYSGLHKEDSTSSPSASPQRARNFEINRFRGFMQDEPSSALSHYFNAFMEQHREESGGSGNRGSITGGMMSPMKSRGGGASSISVDSLPHSHEIHAALTRIMLLVDTHPISANNAVAASQQQQHRRQGSSTSSTSPADTISEAAAMVLKSVYPAASNLHYGQNPELQGGSYIRADSSSASGTKKAANNVVFRGVRAQIGIDVGDIAIEHLGHSSNGGGRSLLGGSDASVVNRDTLRVAEAYFRGEISDKELLEAREARRKAESEQRDNNVSSSSSPSDLRYHYPNYAGPMSLKAAIYGQSATKSSLLASVARPGETLLSETAREALSEQLIWHRNRTPQSSAPGKSGAHRAADAFASVASGVTVPTNTSGVQEGRGHPPSQPHAKGSKRGSSISVHHSAGYASSFFVAPLSIGALVRGGATGRPSQLRHGHHSLPASQTMATHPLGAKGCQYLDTLFSSTSAETDDNTTGGDGGSGGATKGGAGGKERRGGDMAVSSSTHEEIVYTVLPALLVKRALHFTREVDDGIASRRYIGALNPLWYLPFPAYPTTGGHLAHLWSTVLAALGEEAFGGQRNMIGVVESLSTPMSLSEQLRQAQLSAAGLHQIASDALNAYEYQQSAHKKTEVRLQRVEEECMASHDQSPLAAIQSLTQTKIRTLLNGKGGAPVGSSNNATSTRNWKMFSDVLQEAVVAGLPAGSGSYIRSIVEGPLGLYLCPLLDTLLGSTPQANTSFTKSSPMAREGSLVRFEDTTNIDANTNKNPLLKLPVCHRDNKALLVILALLQNMNDAAGELAEMWNVGSVLEDEVIRVAVSRLTMPAPSPFSNAGSPPGSPRNTTAAASHFSPASTTTQVLLHNHSTAITGTPQSEATVIAAISTFSSMMIESMVAESIIGSTWESLRGMYSNADDDDRIGMWGEVTVAPVHQIRTAIKNSQQRLSLYTGPSLTSTSSSSILACQAVLEFLSRNTEEHMDKGTNTVSVSSLGLVCGVVSWNAFVFERYPLHVAQLGVSTQQNHHHNLPPGSSSQPPQAAQSFTSSAKMYAIMSVGSKRQCQPSHMSIVAILRHILDNELIPFAKGDTVCSRLGIADIVANGGGDGNQNNNNNHLDVVDAYFKDGASAFRPLSSTNRPIESMLGVLPNGRVNTTITTHQHESLKQTVSTVTMTWSLADLLTFAFTPDALSRLFAKLVDAPVDEATTEDHTTTSLSVPKGVSRNPSTLTTGSKLAAAATTPPPPPPLLSQSISTPRGSVVDTAPGTGGATDANFSFKGALAAQKAAMTLLANTRSKVTQETTFAPSTVAESKEALVKGLIKAFAALGHAVADQPDGRALLRILDDRIIPTLRVTNLLDVNTVQQEAILSRYAEQFVLTARDPTNQNYNWFSTFLQSCAVTVSITYAVHDLATLPPLLNEVVTASPAPLHHRHQVMELHGSEVVHHHHGVGGGESITSISDSLTSPLSHDGGHDDQQHMVHQVPITYSQLQHAVRLKSQYQVEGFNFLSIQRWAMQSIHALSESHAHHISIGYISTDTIVVDASVEPGTTTPTSPRSSSKPPTSKTPLPSATCTLPTVGVNDAASSFLQAPAGIGLHILESTTDHRDIQKLVDNTAPELLMCLDRGGGGASSHEGLYNQWLAVVRHHLTGKVLGASCTSSTAGAVPSSISKILTAMMDCVMEGEGRPTTTSNSAAAAGSPTRKSSSHSRGGGGGPSGANNTTTTKHPSSSSLSYPLEQDFLASGLDSALDVWMLGCALFEVICGVHPLSIIRTLEPSNSITGIKLPSDASTTTHINGRAGGSEGLNCCVTECLDYYAMHIKTTYTQEDLRSTMDNNPHHNNIHHRPSMEASRLSMSFAGGGGALSGLGGGGSGLASTMRSAPIGRNRSSTIAAPNNRRPSSALGMSFNGGDFERQQAALSLAGGGDLSPPSASASHNLAASTRMRRLSVAAVSTTASRRPFGSVTGGDGGAGMVNNDSFGSPMEHATITRRRGYSNAGLLGGSPANNPRSPLLHDDSTSLLPLLLCARNTSILGRDAGTALRLLKLGMCTQKGWGTSPFSRECGYKVEKNLEDATHDHNATHGGEDGRPIDVSAAFSMGSSEYANEDVAASSATTLHTLEEASLVLLADLLHKMLRANPFERISAAEALQHPYFFLQPMQAVSKSTSSSSPSGGGGGVSGQVASPTSRFSQSGMGSPTGMGSPSASFRGMGTMRDKPDPSSLPTAATLVPPSQRTSLRFPACHYLHTPPPVQQPHIHHHASQPLYQPSWSEEISHVALHAILGSSSGKRTSKRSSGDVCPTVVLSMPRNSSLPHILPLPTTTYSLDDSTNTLHHTSSSIPHHHNNPSSRFAINDDLRKIPSINISGGDNSGGGIQLLDITRHPNYVLQREYLEAIVLESARSAESYQKTDMDTNLRKFISGAGKPNTTHGGAGAQGVLQGGKASLLEEVSKALRVTLSRNTTK